MLLGVFRDHMESIMLFVFWAGVLFSLGKIFFSHSKKERRSSKLLRSISYLLLFCGACMFMDPIVETTLPLKDILTIYMGSLFFAGTVVLSINVVFRFLLYLFKIRDKA